MDGPFVYFEYFLLELILRYVKYVYTVKHTVDNACCMNISLRHYYKLTIIKEKQVACLFHY